MAVSVQAIGNVSFRRTTSDGIIGEPRFPLPDVKVWWVTGSVVTTADVPAGSVIILICGVAPNPLGPPGSLTPFYPMKANAHYISGAAPFNSPKDSVGNSYYNPDLVIFNAKGAQTGDGFDDDGAYVIISEPVAFTPAGTLISMAFGSYVPPSGDFGLPGGFNFVATIHAYSVWGADRTTAAVGVSFGSINAQGVESPLQGIGTYFPTPPQPPLDWKRFLFGGPTFGFSGQVLKHTSSCDYDAVWISGLVHNYSTWPHDLDVTINPVLGSSFGASLITHTTGWIGVGPWDPNTPDVGMSTGFHSGRLRQSDLELQFGGVLEPDPYTASTWCTINIFLKQRYRAPKILYSARGPLLASNASGNIIYARRMDSGDATFNSGNPKPDGTILPWSAGNPWHKGFWVGSSFFQDGSWIDYPISNGTVNVTSQAGSYSISGWISGKCCILWVIGNPKISAFYPMSSIREYPAAFNVWRMWSDDDGLSAFGNAWGGTSPFEPPISENQVLVFTAGRFPIVRFDSSAGGGTTLYAAMVGSSPCKIHGAIEASGDTVPGTEYVFKDETATDITVDDDPFDICKGSAGTWWLTALKGGVVKYWTSDDMKTWKLSAL